MFDTVALSETTFRRPDDRLAGREGVRSKYSQAGELYQLFVNETEGSAEPRITLTKTRQSSWIIRPEVSIGAWMFGSNLHLPTEDDIPQFFEMMNSYIGERTGMVFDAQNARTARVDITKDFKLAETRVLTLLNEYRAFPWAKYNTIFINGTTINFDSRGKKLSRRVALYSKFHERQNHGAPAKEQEMARGLLRLEVQHRTNKSLADLAQSLKLSDHKAKTILSSRVRDFVLEKVVARLRLEEAIERSGPTIEFIFNNHGHSLANRIVTHLALTAKLGRSYYLNPLFGVSPKTARQYTVQAAKSGVFTLE